MDSCHVEEKQTKRQEGKIGWIERLRGPVAHHALKFFHSGSLTISPTDLSPLIYHAPSRPVKSRQAAGRGVGPGNDGAQKLDLDSRVLSLSTTT